MLTSIYWFAYEYFCLSKGFQIRYTEDDIKFWFAPENISIATQDKIRKAIMDSQIGGQKFGDVLTQMHGKEGEKKK